MSWPTDPRPAEFSLGGMYPTLVSRSRSLKRETRTRGAHRFMPWARWDPMKRDEWAPLVAIIESMHGQYEKIELPVWGLEAPRGVISGTIQVNSAASKGANVVSLKGFPTGSTTTGVLKARDLLRFAGHKKLYSVQADANSNSSGIASVTLNQWLEASLASNEAVSYSNLTVQVGLVSDTVPGNWKGGLICPGFEVQFEEDPT